MKKLILTLGVILITLSACDTVCNHKDAVVIEKNETFLKMKIRYQPPLSGRYVIQNIFVTKYEYDMYNVGDTIK
jgi:hypothetical protein